MRIRKKREKRQMRHKRVRTRVRGTSECPRLSVFRSNKHVWLQMIDDTAGKTVAFAGDVEIKSKKNKGMKVDVMEKLGELVAQKAAKKNITRVVFDRGGYKYHGLVKAVAEGARKGGLKF